MHLMVSIKLSVVKSSVYTYLISKSFNILMVALGKKLVFDQTEYLNRVKYCLKRMS